MREEKEWREQIRICGGWKFVDKPKTPEEEDAVQKIIQEYEEKERVRKEEYERKVASGEITEALFPVAIKVQPRTVAFEEVKVKPMSLPSPLLNYMDFKSGDEDDWWKED